MARAQMTGKEELGLLTTEAGEAAAPADAEATAPAQTRRWPVGRRTALAATLLGVALASTVAAVLLRRGPAARATAEAAPASGGAAETTAAVQLFERYRTCGACQCDCDWVRVQNACSAQARDSQCCWSCCCAGMADVGYDPGFGAGLQGRPAQQVVYAPAPVQQSDEHFVTHVHHDVLPGYQGDAYHGSAGAGSLGGYPSYHTHTYVYHHSRSASMLGGASVWWIVLFLVLSVLGCVGCYYYFYKK